MKYTLCVTENQTIKYIKKTININFKKIVLVLVFIIMLLFVSSLIFNNSDNSSVAFESLNNIYINKPSNNKTFKLTHSIENMDFSLIKSDNRNKYFYYPDNISIENGIMTFDIYESDLKNNNLMVVGASYNYVVSKNGRYIAYYTNVSNQYGNDTADLYLYDKKSNENNSILIDTNVIISSVKFSDDNKNLIYLTSDNNELRKYVISKNKSKKIDSNVDSIIYSSENLDKILYCKLKKQKDSINSYNLYSYDGNKIYDVATDVIKNSIHYSEHGIIYLKIPDKYPNYNILKDFTKTLTLKENKQLKELFNTFCIENIFTLAEVDFKGKQEDILCENVYKINYISNSGNDIIVTVFKNIKDIDTSSINSFDDILSNKCLESYIYDINRRKLKLSRVDDNTLLDSYNNYSFDDVSNTIYYIDDNSLVDLNYSTSYSYNILDDNVKNLLYNGNTLIYLKDDNTLMQIYAGDDPKVIAENVIPESISLNNDNVYYTVKNKKDKAQLYVKHKKQKSKKICDNLASFELVTSGNYLYFIDTKDGLCYYDGKRVNKVDNNATNVYEITNN